ncbi:MAG: hypothetical protein ISR58_20795 [Anaerolineales bacterium]|nr:hypothetical protein [Anaerolineales bacterium]
MYQRKVSVGGNTGDEDLCTVSGASCDGEAAPKPDRNVPTACPLRGADAGLEHRGDLPGSWSKHRLAIMNLD